MSDKPIKEIPLQTAIELACAAMRANGEYLSESSVWTTSNEHGHKYPNKELMLIALGEIHTTKYETMPNKPALLCTNLEDREFANTIQKYFRKLLFTAIEGGDEFRTSLFTILNKETVPVNHLGFVACLPSTYYRDKYESSVKNAENGFLGLPGDELLDLDCEIIKCNKSKNYDAYNVDAIIDNKLVSWMGKQSVAIGPCVLVKGKVKELSKHWKHPVDVTRLNYVKAFQ